MTRISGKVTQKPSGPVTAPKTVTVAVSVDNLEDVAPLTRTPSCTVGPIAGENVTVHLKVYSSGGAEIEHATKTVCAKYGPGVGNSIAKFTFTINKHGDYTFIPYLTSNVSAVSITSEPSQFYLTVEQSQTSTSTPGPQPYLPGSSSGGSSSTSTSSSSSTSGSGSFQSGGTVELDNVGTTVNTFRPKTKGRFTATLNNTTSSKQNVTIHWKLDGTTKLRASLSIPANQKTTIRAYVLGKSLHGSNVSYGKHTLSAVLLSSTGWTKQSLSDGIVNLEKSKSSTSSSTSPSGSSSTPTGTKTVSSPSSSTSTSNTLSGSSGTTSQITQGNTEYLLAAGAGIAGAIVLFNQSNKKGK